MNVGVIGLGTMGGPIAKKFHISGINLAVYDTNPIIVKEFKNSGFTVKTSIEELSAFADVIWLMVPAQSVQQVLNHLCTCVKPDTVIIDGGNSFYKDSQRRAEELRARELAFLDCGTSGGLWGAEHGFCLTVGGDNAVFKRIEAVFADLAVSKNAYLYVGPSGAGHYVKMVHNGIEYALMQAYADGFFLLHNSPFKQLDIPAISFAWEHGAIIRSWLLTLIHEILEQDANLENIKGSIGENGTGRWTVETADKLGIKVPAIEAALAVREQSRKTGGNYATKLVAMLRHVMGGHRVEQEACELCTQVAGKN